MSVVFVLGEGLLFALALAQICKRNPSSQHPVFRLGNRAGIEQVYTLVN